MSSHSTGSALPQVSPDDFQHSEYAPTEEQLQTTMESLRGIYGDQLDDFLVYFRRKLRTLEETCRESIERIQRVSQLSRELNTSLKSSQKAGTEIPEKLKTDVKDLNKLCEEMIPMLMQSVSVSSAIQIREGSLKAADSFVQYEFKQYSHFHKILETAETNGHQISLKEITRELSEATKSHEKMATNIISLETTLGMIDSRHVDMEKVIEEIGVTQEDQLGKVFTTCQSLRQSIAKLSQDLEEKTAKYDELNQQYQDLKAAFQQMQKTADEKDDLIANALEVLNARIEEVSRERQPSNPKRPLEAIEEGSDLEDDSFVSQSRNRKRERLEQLEGAKFHRLPSTTGKTVSTSTHPALIHSASASSMASTSTPKPASNIPFQPSIYKGWVIDVQGMVDGVTVPASQLPDFVIIQAIELGKRALDRQERLDDRKHTMGAHCLQTILWKGVSVWFDQEKFGGACERCRGKKRICAQAIYNPSEKRILLKVVPEPRVVRQGSMQDMYPGWMPLASPLLSTNEVTGHWNEGREP